MSQASLPWMLALSFGAGLQHKNSRGDALMPKTAAAALATLCALALPVQAQAPDEFYRGKQVRIVVGTASGGDYDVWARLIARHLVRRIPGNPAIIVENMPGAGSL